MKLVVEMITHFTAQEREQKGVIDAELDTKKIIHAEIVYGKQSLRMQGVSAVNRELVELERKTSSFFKNCSY
jgi:hypothetical protein